MNVTITGDQAQGFSWSDGISTVGVFPTPHAALDDYMTRYGYAALGG
jgi:hypothetical protein